MRNHEAMYIREKCIMYRYEFVRKWWRDSNIQIHGDVAVDC